MRVTIISPGLREHELRGSRDQSGGESASSEKAWTRWGCSPEAIARAIVFAIEQPADVDVNEIIVRPTAQT